MRRLMISFIFSFFAIVTGWLAMPLAAAEQRCEIDRKIVFGGLDYDSNSFHNDVVRFILEKGYGCKTDVIPGSTIPILAGAVRGDIDVVMEIWHNNEPQIWLDALKSGKVKTVGINFPDAVQNWYIPKYLVEGESAPAKDLKSVSDLVKYKNLFKDPEEPSKGRFYNCILGWVCEVINTKKLAVYHLDNDFVNFRSGTGAAMAAAIESAIRQKKPILFYYWGPTWLMGKIGNDVVALQEPAYNEAKWKALIDAKSPADIKEATAYPVVATQIGVNSAFAAKAPILVSFLSHYKTTADIVSKALVYMQENDGSAEKAAQNFLRTRPDLWTSWVPADIAERVKGALKES
jgi:glycine betaine/proline transport system substrate-binding protein